VLAAQHRVSAGEGSRRLALEDRQRAKRLVRVAPGAASLGLGAPQAYLTGFRAVMACSAAVCLLAALTAALTIPGRSAPLRSGVSAA